MRNRPIVYSARYYLPGRTHSYYQVYRINPDGSGKHQLTEEKSDDTVPRWSPDGKAIAFSRSWDDRAKPSAICTMSPEGDASRVIFRAERSADSVWAGWISRERLLVYARQYPNGVESGRYSTYVVNSATGKVERTIRKTWQHALSPDRTYLAVWSDGKGEDDPIRIVRLTDGRETPLEGDDLQGAFVWLDKSHLVCVGGPWEQPILYIYTLDGKRQTTQTIHLGPQAQAWLEKNGGRDCVASFIYPLPGVRDSVLVGWQLGGSQQGQWAATFRVKLATGAATPWAITCDIVSSPNKAMFLTSRPRDLVPIDSQRKVWATPLLIGTTTEPERQRPLITGRVNIAGFDWRPQV